ncbi:MAG: hypothetical protein OSJ63_06305 [Bacilli bacterium]|nr:hypothetical protein [Bacilli bacterium]
MLFLILLVLKLLYVGRLLSFTSKQLADIIGNRKLDIIDQVKIINYVGRTISDINNKPTS